MVVPTDAESPLIFRMCKNSFSHMCRKGHEKFSIFHGLSYTCVLTLLVRAHLRRLDHAPDKPSATNAGEQEEQGRSPGDTPERGT